MVVVQWKWLIFGIFSYNKRTSSCVNDSFWPIKYLHIVLLFRHSKHIYNLCRAPCQNPTDTVSQKDWLKTIPNCTKLCRESWKNFLPSNLHPHTLCSSYGLHFPKQSASSPLLFHQPVQQNMTSFKTTILMS